MLRGLIRPLAVLLVGAVALTSPSPARAQLWVGSGEMWMDDVNRLVVRSGKYLGVRYPTTLLNSIFVVACASAGGAAELCVAGSTLPVLGIVDGLFDPIEVSIVTSGTAFCNFDGATTDGHYVQLSAITDGECHDAGESPPTNGKPVLGIVKSTNGGAGAYEMTVFGPATNAVSPVRTLALTSNATANSTTTGVEITGLNQATGVGTYTFTYTIRYQSAATTTGVKFGVNHTGTAGVFLAAMRMQPTSSAAQTDANQAVATPVSLSGASTRTKSTTAPNLGPTISVDTAEADMLAIIEGLIIVTAAGDLELWHASGVAAASTVMAGSSLVLTRTSP